METSFTLPRHERLRSRGSIRRLFESGQSGFVYPLRYMWVADKVAEGELSQISCCEVLFSVPKRFQKRANKRNLLRRRVKESYRLHKQAVLAGETAYQIDLAIVYSTKEQHSYKTIDNAVQKILGNIAKAL